MPTVKGSSEKMGKDMSYSKCRLFSRNHDDIHSEEKHTGTTRLYSLQYDSTPRSMPD